ncbi:MAG TPA: DUF933 domain-containing protein, partial [Candidatus Brocadiia bacterium]|nr:DUF933 domain-containing protein [Candidatus Brocadiia bacterium]
MKLGIVGLPFSGKTTLFRALTGAHGAAGKFTGKANSAIVNVPDARVDRLAQMFPPKSIHLAQIEYVDIPGVDAGERRDAIVATLISIREVDAIVQVIRGFDDPACPHPKGSLDPIRDARELWEEILIADMDIAERRIEKLRKQVTKPIPTLEEDRKQLAVLERCMKAFEEGKGVNAVEMTDAERVSIRTFQFLTEKPMLTVLNVAEDKLDCEETRAAAAALGQDVIVLSAKIEMELAELEPEERKEFMESLGIQKTASEILVRASYKLLKLRSFFTGIGLDFYVWTVREGENAWAAAGKVHSDIQRGFIRAEIIRYDDVIELGSE